jgi:uncharacterized protein YndB with AHSA1/START domain
MMELPHQLNRTVVIKAEPATVFRYFTDSARWANWWGAGSTIDATPGGKVYIRHPNGVEAMGEVLQVQSPREIVFTLGYASGAPMPPGSSRVTIRLEPDSGGTQLRLLHEFAEASPRDHHVQGWRFQLSLFSNVVTNEVYADAANRVDAWFDAWAIADDREREAKFAGIVAPGIQFRDRYSLLDGIEDLTTHAGAALRFMPGVRLQRKGNVRQCQGMVLSDWTVLGNDGTEVMAGTNAFVFAPDGKFESVTGFANSAR